MRQLILFIHVIELDHETLVGIAFVQKLPLNSKCCSVSSFTLIENSSD